MSLILDALNRAERERKKNQAIPDLQTVHEPALPPDEPIPGKSYARLLLAVVVSMLALAVIVYGLRQTPSPLTQSAPVPQLPAVPEATPQVPTKEVKKAAPLSAESSGARALPVSEPLVNLPSSERNEAPEVVPAIAPPSSDGAATNTESNAPAQSMALDELYATARDEEARAQPSVSDLYVAPEAEPQARRVRPTPVVEAAAESVVAPLAVAVRNYESLIEIPDIGDLPSGLRKEIPSLNYVRHNFDVDGVTSVVINGRAHNAGAALAPDLVLEEIYMDGVIFRFKQIQFKLRALNSWINM